MKWLRTSRSYPKLGFRHFWCLVTENTQILQGELKSVSRIIVLDFCCHKKARFWTGDEAPSLARFIGMDSFLKSEVQGLNFFFAYGKLLSWIKLKTDVA